MPDYTTFCQGTDLNGITISVPRNTWVAKSPEPIEASFESALKTMHSAGAKVIDNANFPNVEEFKNSIRKSKVLYDHQSLKETLFDIFSLWLPTQIISVQQKISSNSQKPFS